MSNSEADLVGGRRLGGSTLIARHSDQDGFCIESTPLDALKPLCMSIPAQNPWADQSYWWHRLAIDAKVSVRGSAHAY